MAINLKRDSKGWVIDSEVSHCMECNISFTLSTRRHHCRVCGNCVCNSCSRFYVFRENDSVPVRACISCATNSESTQSYCQNCGGCLCKICMNMQTESLEISNTLRSNNLIALSDNKQNICKLCISKIKPQDGISACMFCKTQFTLFSWKYTCGVCKAVICVRCSNGNKKVVKCYKCLKLTSKKSGKGTLTKTESARLERTFLKAEKQPSQGIYSSLTNLPTTTTTNTNTSKPKSPSTSKPTSPSTSKPTSPTTSKKHKEKLLEKEDALVSQSVDSKNILEEEERSEMDNKNIGIIPEEDRRESMENSIMSKEQTIQSADSKIVNISSLPPPRDYYILWKDLKSSYAQPAMPPDKALQIVLEIIRLEKSFIETATKMVQLIINESNIPTDQKTLPPVSGTEVIKYGYGGIVVKYAVDSHKLYGNNNSNYYFAGKAAGLDRISNFVLANIRNIGKNPNENLALSYLRSPMSCIVDYRGHRLIAYARLPISNDTLVYGCSDISTLDKNFKNEDRITKSIVSDLAGILNIKQHTATTSTGWNRKISLPIDIEIHKVHENEYYMADSARLFPPVHPTLWPSNKVSEPALIYRFRPELVVQWKEKKGNPLNPDAFSGFSVPDPKLKQDEEDILSATIYLRDEIIPSCAKFLDNLQWFHIHLNFVLHSFGVNLRYLGLVRHKCSSHKQRAMCLLEIIVRSVKQKLFKEMRELRKSPNEDFFNLTVNTFNRVLGLNYEESETFWKIEIKSLIENHFLSSLTPSEESSSYDLRYSLQPYLPRYQEYLFLQLCSLTGISFPDISTNILPGNLEMRLHEILPAFDDGGDGVFSDEKPRTNYKATHTHLLYRIARGLPLKPGEVKLETKVKTSNFSYFDRGYCITEIADSIVGIEQVNSLKVGMENLVKEYSLTSYQLYRLGARDFLRSVLCCTVLGNNWDMWARSILNMSRLFLEFPDNFYNAKIITEQFIENSYYESPELFEPYCTVGELTKFVDQIINLYIQISAPKSMKAQQITLSLLSDQVNKGTTFFLNKAKEALLNNSTSEALQFFKNAATLDSANHDTLYKVIDIATSLGIQATKYIPKLVSYMPADVDIAKIKRTSLILLDSHLYNVAIQFLRNALQVYPEDSQLWHFLGLAWERIDLCSPIVYSEALRAFEQAVLYSESNMQSHINVAKMMYILYINQRRSTEFATQIKMLSEECTLENIESHLKIAENDEDDNNSSKSNVLFLLLGIVKLEQGDIDAAHQYFTVSIWEDLFCTKSKTGNRFVKQSWFNCKTCNLTSETGKGCCEICIRNCHKDHEIIKMGVEESCCECNPCKCLAPEGCDPYCGTEIIAILENNKLNNSEKLASIRNIVLKDYLIKDEKQYINTLSHQLSRPQNLETNTVYGLLEAELWNKIENKKDLSAATFIQLHQTILDHSTLISNFFGIRLADDFIWNNIKRVELLTLPPLNVLSLFSLFQLYDKLVNISLQLELYEETYTYKALSLYHLLLLCKAMRKYSEYKEELSILPSTKDLEGMLSQNLNLILNIYQQYAQNPMFAKYSETFYIMEKSPGKPAKKKYILEVYENSLNVHKDTKTPEDNTAKEVFSIPMAQVQAISDIHENGFSILLKNKMYTILGGENTSSIKVLWKTLKMIVCRLRRLAEVLRWVDGTSVRITYPCSLTELLSQKDITILPLVEETEMTDLRSILTTLSAPYCNQQLVD